MIIELFQSEINRHIAPDQVYGNLSLSERRRIASKIVSDRGGNRNETISQRIQMNIPDYSWFVVSNDIAANVLLAKARKAIQESSSIFSS